jgi:hypothetical protein
MSCIKAFLTILAAQALVGASKSASKDDGLKFMASTKKDTCKADNDFVYQECGSKKEEKQCCDTRSVCIEAENKKGEKWEKVYYCSMSRGMTGTKLLKIILIPLILFIVAIKFVVLMVLKLDIKGNHVTKVGVAVIAVAWPTFLSDKWIYGAYSCIVALFVSFVSQSPKMWGPSPWWVYRLAWIMCAFQMILLLGPIESFHVPFYRQSLGANTDLVNTVLKTTEETCNVHFENFFTLTGIELAAKEVNPDAKYYGLCANGWLNFIQIILIIQAFLWFAALLVSSLVLLADPANMPSKAMAKVQPDQILAIPPAAVAKAEPVPVVQEQAPVVVKVDPDKDQGVAKAEPAPEEKKEEA